MKDPAVLFYTQDFITGTILMTDEQRGKYIMLLCLQHQNGKLTERDMVKICGKKDEDIWCKFYQENGYFYNKRMLLESEKRAKYCNHQKENINKRWNKKGYHGNTTVLPLENENENENEDINRDEKRVINVPFEKFWNLYDKKEDRIKCERKWNNLMNKERENCITNLPVYILSTPDKQFRKNPATYLNNKSWENEIIKPTEKPKIVLTYDEILKASEKDPDIWNRYKAVKREGERKAIFEPIK
jgi:hypothetical protein